MGNFAEILSNKRTIIADGGMGTMLRYLGLPAGVPPDLWNLDNPLAVQQVHRDYLDAGCDLILTNTFGAARVRLEQFQLADRFYEINRTAVDLARSAALDKLVVGSIGPAGVQSHSVMRAAYAEQALVLAERGVDALLIETVTDLTEAQIALEGIQPVVRLPIMVSVVFDHQGRTYANQSAGQVADVLAASGVTVVGANCCTTIEGLLIALSEMRIARPDLTLLAKPNAGLPQSNQGHLSYDLGADQLAEYAMEFRRLDIKIVGGCCGTTPAHITALKHAIDPQRNTVATAN